MSDLSGARVLSCLPLAISSGSWRADIVLEGGDAPPIGSTQTLTVADLSLVGTVLRSADDAPDRPHVVMVGGSGWDKLIAAPISFQSDAGVRTSTILNALAMAADQKIEQPGEVIVGNYYECLASRVGDPVRYSDALSDLYRSGYIPFWRVDPDGVTRFGARAPIVSTSRATVIRRNMGVGKVTIGLDSPASFLPGTPFENGIIDRVDVREESHKLEADLWLAEPVGAPSIRQSAARMVESLFRDFFRTYIVEAVRADKRLDLRPLPDAMHLPEMLAVEQWALGGALVTPIVGAEVAVIFRDSNRTRPIAVAFGPGTPVATTIDATTLLTLGASAAEVDIASGTDAVVAGTETKRVVCYGDTIMFPSGAAATPTALPVLASAPLAIGAPTSPASVSKVRGR